METLRFIPYTANVAEHKAAFSTLNRAWIEKYFVIEDEDERTFSDPEGKILANGGYILLAALGDQCVGTGALLKHDDYAYEIAKMAISESFQGKGIGRRMAEKLIEHARKLGARKIVIASNRKLESALKLYRNLGFVETPCRSDPRYARCDIMMELVLEESVKEFAGRGGLDPARYGDWEIKGKCVDF